MLLLKRFYLKHKMIHTRVDSVKGVNKQHQCDGLDEVKIEATI